VSVRVAHVPGRLRLTLDAPHGNVITDAMVGTLREALAGAGRAATKLVTIEGAGRDFSYGSSIEEHSPSRMPEVLPRFHALIVELLRVPAVTCAVVAGRCLGGGFEIALACDVIIASDDAVMGLPEVEVGAFPPVGSILLPLKVGAARAARAVVSGEPRPVKEWSEAGLVELVVRREELDRETERWYSGVLEGRSAAALRRAALASRLVVMRSIDALLPQAERLYLNDLLSTADAAEGVAAFLEKRAPRWTDS
jgi:cyclohexa-1,5-dienecarbonyl-CoA hydratase